jgi:hypothetical protein
MTFVMPEEISFTEEEIQERIKNSESIYRLMLPIANQNGYALLLHGSKVRDVDMVAVPWVEEACTQELLIKAFCVAFQLSIVKFEQRPHNRYSYALYKKGWSDQFIDISVINRT